METPRDPIMEEHREALDQSQIEAAESAKTVGAFVEDFRARAKRLAWMDQALIDQRMADVEKAAEGNESLRLADLERGVLGQNMIGGGDEGVKLSREVFAGVRGKKDVDQVQHVVAHERAHGEQVALTGELMLDGEVIEHELLYEGDAEIAGNEELGKGAHHHREGQPGELYEEGQDIFVTLESRVEGGRAKIRSVLRGTGNLNELQGAIAA